MTSNQSLYSLTRTRKKAPRSFRGYSTANRSNEVLPTNSSYWASLPRTQKYLITLTVSEVFNKAAFRDEILIKVFTFL